MSAAAVSKMRAWRKDPIAFVRDVFKAEPDAWQARVLTALANPKTRKLAMKACKGPGKSCVSAWSIWWIMACHVDAQGLCVSITAANLADNLWKELALWHSKSALLQAAFTVDSEFLRSKERPKTWWCHARSFPQQADKDQQANTLAGLHGNCVFIVLDEVGDYPDGVLAAAEGIFANAGSGIEQWLIIAGNPTRSAGPLYRVCTREADLWEIVTITGDPDDPQRSPRISLDWAREQISKLGRDNPWVMVNVLGEFPGVSSNQLIGHERTSKAMARDVPLLSYSSEPIVWGLDPARYGDDEMALARRQGLLCRKFFSWRNLNGPELARKVLALRAKAEADGEAPDKLFIDVGSVGSSCYDHLVELGYGRWVIPVDFGGSADDASIYANKRAEIWGRMAQWVNERPVSLPNDPVLFAELTAPTYGYRVVNKRTVLLIESKDDMKKRGVASPNRADALALTFAAPVANRIEQGDSSYARGTSCKSDFNPFQTAEERRPLLVAAHYNPYDPGH